MGLSDYESKRYVEAIRELEAALASGVKRLTDAQRSEVEDVLERSRRFVASYELALPSDAIELRLDGEPVTPEAGGILRVDPGEHVLSVRRASGPGRELSFRADVGARGTLTLAPDAPVGAARVQRAGAGHERAASLDEGDAGSRAGAWVAGGATLAFGAASGVFGLLALDANDDFKERAASGRPAAEAKRDGQRYQLLANVGLGITVAAAVTTAVLFVVEGGGDDDARAEARVALHLGPGAIAVRGSL
jgi:hypothetical protein